MSAYISQQAVSNWLKQYGQDVLHGKYKFSLMYIWKNLMDLPATDVVRVVRCKDCRKRRFDGYCTVHQQNIHGIAAWWIPDDNYYCGDGVKKEDEKDA